MSLHYQMVSEEVKSTLVQLMKIKELAPFRLVGGTALALQLGHRSSVDIDLFAGGGAPQPHELGEILKLYFPKNFQITRFQRFGIAAFIHNVKVDLYDWKVPFSSDPVVIDSIRMASVEDIFASKCEALLGRRVEKDFSDLSEIIRHVHLDKLFDTLIKRYPYLSKSAVVAILLKPSAFERDLSIKYAQGKSWDGYQQTLTRAIAQYEDDLINSKINEMAQREKKIQELINQKKNKKS